MIGPTLAKALGPMREKMNKIRIYIVIVTMHICIITIANLYIYTIIEGLMQSKFRKYCVNFASFSILYIFTPTDVNALMTTSIITMKQRKYFFG